MDSWLKRHSLPGVFERLLGDARGLRLDAAQQLSRGRCNVLSQLGGATQAVGMAEGIALARGDKAGYDRAHREYWKVWNLERAVTKRCMRGR